MLSLLLLTRPARANRYVTYVVRPTDTAESIAAEYYGNRARALFLTEFNGLPKGTRLKAGQTLRIPTSYRYKLAQKETLDDVAGRLLGDRRRGSLLMQLSQLRPGTPIGTGTEIQIPFHFFHLTRPGETLASIARTYYGDPGQARLLALYNFRKSPTQPPAPGERLVVPITHVKVRAVRLPTTPTRIVRRPTPVPVPVPAPVQRPVIVEADVDQRLAEAREAELATRVRARLSEAESHYQKGNYTEVPAALTKLLAEEEPSESQLIELYRLLACAYVALGETELAVKALRELLDRQPDFTFDPVQTSPKIRSALDRARAGS